MLDMKNSFTAYFTSIRNKFRCWCCCSASDVEPPQNDSEGDNRADVEFHMELHTRETYHHRRHGEESQNTGKKLTL